MKDETDISDVQGCQSGVGANNCEGEGKGEAEERPGHRQVSDIPSVYSSSSYLYFWICHETDKYKFKKNKEINVC